MIKKFLNILLSTTIVLSPTMSSNPQVSSPRPLIPTQHVTKYMYGSKVDIIKASATKLSADVTLKGHRAGVNCSYFNMNTKKPVKINLYNRPFIIIKKDGTVKISDNKLDIVDEKQVLSGGSWLINENKSFKTEDHFTKDFRNVKVKRTCFGIDKEGNILLIVVSNANFNKCTKIMQDLKIEYGINLDGGTSSIMKYNGKIIVSSKRPVVDYLIVD